jgi:hypothetical protein
VTSTNRIKQITFWQWQSAIVKVCGPKKYQEIIDKMREDRLKVNLTNKNG